MNTIRLPLVVVLGLGLLTPVFGQNPDRKINVLKGPATARLGSVAEIQVPEGYEFIDGKTMRDLLKAVGESVDDNLLGSIAPVDRSWSVMFSFEAIGYVKDDDKDKLNNPDKLLEDYRRGTEEANKVRAKAGIPPIHVTGWERVPKYNEATHNLEWAIRGTGPEGDILNFDTRLLGRRGVMVVTLIVEPKDFAATLPAFTSVMDGYKFETGQSYAEYRSGDKVAKYGLAALVTAGAAVGAAKLGLFAPVVLLFKKLGKAIILVFVAIIAFFRKILARLFGRGGSRPTT